MRIRALSVAAVVAFSSLSLAAPAGAHKDLKTGRYECWLTKITQYSNYDLKIQDGNSYVFMLNDGSWKRSGEFSRDGQKIKFTSGYLKEKNFKGKHDSYTNSYGHTHVIYLYKGSYTYEDLKYDCNNN